MDTTTDRNVTTATSTAVPLGLSIEPILQTSPTVAAGRYTCIVCFQSCDRRKRKSQEMQQITKSKRTELKNRAELWTKYDHHYNLVLSKVDWGKENLYIHKNCRTSFFKEATMSRCQEIRTTIDEPTASADSAPSLPTKSKTISQTRQSSRLTLSYSSTKENPSCIICFKEKYDDHHHKIPVATMDRKKSQDDLHEVEKTMIEFANIHIEKNTAHRECGERIKLMRGTNPTLFNANVGFHRCCYKSFCSSYLKNKPNTDPTPTYSPIRSPEFIDEFTNLIEYLIVVKKEVYTLRQLRELWADIKGVEVSSVRAVDVKIALNKRLLDKIQFCKAAQSSSNSSEYVLPSDRSVLPNAIHSIVTGSGITNHIQLKALSRQISKNIQSHPKLPWPPTPQDVIEGNEILDKRLYNVIAWIVSPSSYLGKDGYVNLLPGKATKVSEICYNIQSLVPGGQPSLGQILLSLTMFGKTGSKNVVNDLRHLGHGLSYTESNFIMDKWAEWSLKQKSIVPSNMKKTVIATHVFDNIDWKNKNIKRTESHYTNSILVQKYNLSDELSKVTLEPDYNFSRKNHRSFKSTESTLPGIYFKRGNPAILNYHPSNHNGECKKSSLKTLVWIRSRISKGVKVPSWSGFQALTTEKDLDMAVVGYLPPIPDTPTEMKVIYAEIERSEQIRIELETEFIFIEADQAIYTKVMDAMFKMKDEGRNYMDRIIPRMGGFHITICMLRTIYSLFQNIGLVQLLSAAGLGGMGTVKKALKGGDVNEGIHLHKKLFESILRFKIKHLTSLSENIADELDQIISNMKENINNDALQRVLESEIVAPLPTMTGDMACFVDVYLEMVDMMLNFVHFLRTGNWKGYLEVIFQFLPYCFRLNRHNYARNLSYYYVHMLSLKEENARAYMYLENGGFTGSITGNSHSRLPFDHIIETTLNKQCKGIGGIGGNTENLGATERWVRINHYMAALREKMNQKIGKRTKMQHIELGSGRINRDINDVLNITHCLESWIPQLWNPDTPITNISSGVKATSDMKDDVIDLKERGETLRDEFIGRFTRSDSKKSYYDEIKRQEMKLFKAPKQEKKRTIADNENQSLTEILVMYDEKKLNLKYFMNWCLFDRPWMFIKEDETSRENRKSVFRNHIQSMSPIEPTSDIPPNIKTVIVDAMRIVQMVSVAGLAKRTFRCWTERFVKQLSPLPGENLHVLFDNYNYLYDIPCKNRGTSNSERAINDLDQELPPTSEWPEFLKNRENKRQLVNLLADYLLESALSHKNLYVNKEIECFNKPIGSTKVRCPGLDSTHREADQMIPMHAVSAGGCADDTICVLADDSDIFISLLYVSHLIPSKLYFRQGKSSEKKGITYHDVHSLANNLGRNICNILPCFHTLTGSDYTFPFYYRSKITVLRNMLKVTGSHELLESMLTDTPNVEKLTEFVLRIVYNRPAKEKTLGDARYNMIKTKKKDSKGQKKFPTSKSLPPDHSSLKMKILRSTYFSHIMSRCLDANYVPLDSSLYGFRKVNDIWEPVWYEGNPLPDPREVEEANDEDEPEDDYQNELVYQQEVVDEEIDDSDSEYAESCSEDETYSEEW